MPKQKRVGEVILTNDELDKLFNSITTNLTGFRFSSEEFKKHVTSERIEKFRVKELKEIIDFLNTEKKLRIKKTGKKNDLVERVCQGIYKKNQNITFPPTIQLPRQSTKGMFNVPNIPQGNPVRMVRNVIFKGRSTQNVNQVNVNQVNIISRPNGNYVNNAPRRFRFANENDIGNIFQRDGQIRFLTNPMIQMRDNSKLGSMLSVQPRSLEHTTFFDRNGKPMRISSTGNLLTRPQIGSISRRIPINQNRTMNHSIPHHQKGSINRNIPINEQQRQINPMKQMKQMGQMGKLQMGQFMSMYAHKQQRNQGSNDQFLPPTTRKTNPNQNPNPNSNPNPNTNWNLHLRNANNGSTGMIKRNINIRSDPNVLAIMKQRMKIFFEKKARFEAKRKEYLLNDLTLNGKISPFYQIERILELKILRNVQTMKVDLSDDEQRKLQSGEFEFHGYLTDNVFGPVNWFPLIQVQFNDQKINPPKPNRKLAKKTKQVKKLLMNHSPMIIIGKNEEETTTNTTSNLDVNINDLIKTEVNKTNVMKISNPPLYNGKLLIFFVIVKTKTLKDLSDIVTLNSKDNYFRSETHKINEKTINTSEIGSLEDESADISVGEEIVSLTDPILISRIEVPVKGVDCKHMQAFDLSTYLEYAKNSRVWNCPVCQRVCNSVDLFIDEKMKRILERVNENIEQIKLNIDGSVTPIDPNSRKMLTEKKFHLSKEYPFKILPSIMETEKPEEMSNLYGGENDSFFNSPTDEFDGDPSLDFYNMSQDHIPDLHMPLDVHMSSDVHMSTDVHDQQPVFEDNLEGDLFDQDDNSFFG